MPRRPRYESAGAVHHVYNRGVDRCAIFVDDSDRERYVDLLGYAAREARWEVLAFCLMPNHVHLVVRTAEPTLGIGMHRLHMLYAMHFNDRHVRLGHLFQSRYGSARLWTGERIARAVRYVERNPVEAALCAEPEDWDWGSAGMRRKRKVPWLVSQSRVAEIQAETDDLEAAA